VLKARLRASEELRGGTLSRLERFELHCSSRAMGESGNAAHGRRVARTATGATTDTSLLADRLERLERFVASQGAVLPHSVTRASTDGADSTVQRVVALETALQSLSADGPDDSLQQLAEQLREQLTASFASRSTMAAESEKWRAESEALQREAAIFHGEVESTEQECVVLRERLAESAREASGAAAAAREVEALRARLADSTAQASVLSSQLTARDVDVAQLERRLADAGRWGGVTGCKVDPTSGGGSARWHAASASPVAEVRTATPQGEPGRNNLEVPYNILLPTPDSAADSMSSATTLCPRWDVPLQRAQPKASGWGPWTPPPAGGPGDLSAHNRTRSPVSARSMQVQTTTGTSFASPMEPLTTGQRTPRLVSISSNKELPHLRAPSPQTPHLQAASPIQGQGVAAIAPPPRSQSVPVQVRQASPGGAAAPAVCLARWAGVPGSGMADGRSQGLTAQW